MTFCLNLCIIQTLTNLRDVLADLYVTVQDSRRVVEDAGLRPAFIEFNNKAINNWQNILREANRRAIKEILSGTFERLQASPDGGLWLITDQGVAKLLDTTWTVYLSDFTGTLVGIDAAGRVWVVSEDTGEISAWDGTSWTAYGTDAGWLLIALE